jgi:hypothetical protein
MLADGSGSGFWRLDQDSDVGGRIRIRMLKDGSGSGCWRTDQDPDVGGRIRILMLEDRIRIWMLEDGSYALFVEIVKSVTKDYIQRPVHCQKVKHKTYIFYFKKCAFLGYILSTVLFVGKAVTTFVNVN